MGTFEEWQIQTPYGDLFISPSNSQGDLATITVGDGADTVGTDLSRDQVIELRKMLDAILAVCV